MPIDQSDLEKIERLVHRSADDVAVSIARSFERGAERIEAADLRLLGPFLEREDRVASPQRFCRTGGAFYGSARSEWAFLGEIQSSRMFNPNPLHEESINLRGPIDDVHRKSLMRRCHDHAGRSDLSIVNQQVSLHFLLAYL
jgi:hypothetical protein